MGFPPNPEKQAFIALRLEQNARPGGRSRDAAKKYYGGLYHRMSAEARRKEVEDLRAVKGHEGVEVGKGEGGAKGKGKERKRRKGVMARADSVVAEKGEGNAEGAVEEKTEPDGALAVLAAVAGHDIGTLDETKQDEGAQTDGTEHTPVQPPLTEDGDDSGTADLEQQVANDTTEDADQNAILAALIADGEDSVKPSEAEKQDGSVSVDDAQQGEIATPSRTVAQDSPSTDEAAGPPGPKQHGDEAGLDNDAGPGDVKQTATQPIGTDVDPATDDGVGETAQRAQQHEMSRPDKSDEGSGHFYRFRDVDVGETSVPPVRQDDPAETDAIPEAEDAARSPSRRSSNGVTAGSTHFEQTSEQEDEHDAYQDDGETESFFMSDEDEAGSTARVVSHPGSSERARRSSSFGANTKAQDDEQPHLQEGPDLVPRYSPEEGIDSDEAGEQQDPHQSTMLLQDNSAEDDHKADDLQEQGEFIGWSKSGGAYPSSDSFLPDAMLPESLTKLPPRPPPNSPDSLDTFSGRRPSLTVDGDGDSKKRKLSDELSSLSPAIRAASPDTSDVQEQRRYVGGIVTPDGPKQKRPRLKRPGQHLSQQQGNVDGGDQLLSPSRQPPQVPSSEEATGEPASSGKPSLLSSLLNDVQTRPQYPGQH